LDYIKTVNGMDNKMKYTANKPIDRVTTELLDVALMAVGIKLDLPTIDKVLDVVELLEDKG